MYESVGRRGSHDSLKAKNKCWSFPHSLFLTLFCTPSLPLSLTLSISLSHTHTQTHTKGVFSCLATAGTNKKETSKSGIYSGVYVSLLLNQQFGSLLINKLDSSLMSSLVVLVIKYSFFIQLTNIMVNFF